jgi:hypothetical protein
MNWESDEWREFALKAAPRINRISLILACLIPLTGLGNLYFASRARGFKFAPEFTELLSAKIVLFLGMAMALIKAWSAEAAMKSKAGEDSIEVPVSRGLVRLYALTVAMGTAALALGLWLAGT